MDKVLQPKLRFPEFNYQWSKKTLNHYLNANIKKNTELKFLKEDVLSISATAGVVNQIEYKGRSFAGASVAPYHILNKNQIVYTKSPLKEYPYGIIKWNNFSDGIVSTLYAVYDIFGKNSGKFIDYFFQYPLRINKYLKPLVNIGAKNDMKVNNDVAISGIVVFPSIPEQEKIVLFLSSVDSKIDKLKKKKNLLVEYKKGIMQKIFSQEIRFKDKTGDDYPKWDEKRLGKIFKHRSERGFENLELLSVTINDGVKKRSDIEGKDNSSQDKSNYKKVCKHDIVYNSMRMWQGASGVSPYDGIVSPAYTVLKGNHLNSSMYFGYLFKTTKMINIFQRNSQGLTSDTWNLKYPQLSTIKVQVPCFEEQKKIANFLSSIDSKIEILENEIDKNIDFKKGLLQQMFV